MLPSSRHNVKALLRGITLKVLDGHASVAVWQNAMEHSLAAAHMSAYAVGAGVPLRKLTDQDRAAVEKLLHTQFEHLSEYSTAMKQGKYKESPESALNRTNMYADATKASWWMGKTRGLVLPAYPCDGTTQCLTNCECSWEIITLKGEGNWDAHWKLGATDNCQTCVQRAQEWAPYKIRGGDVQL